MNRFVYCIRQIVVLISQVIQLVEQLSKLQSSRSGQTSNTGTYLKMSSLGFWIISGESLLRALRRIQDGEDPDAVYAEMYANSDIEPVEEIEI